MKRMDEQREECNYVALRVMQIASLTISAPSFLMKQDWGDRIKSRKVDEPIGQIISVNAGSGDEQKSK